MGRILILWVGVMLLLVLFPALPGAPTEGAGTRNVLTYTTHDPIFIEGDADFTYSNGISSGIGTASDPYVIEGWDINASSATGIQIGNTSKYFLVRDCYVHDGARNHSAVRVLYSHYGRIEHNELIGCLIGVYFQSQMTMSDRLTCSIRNNSIMYNSMAGIALHGDCCSIVCGVEIYNNLIANNSGGIAFHNCNGGNKIFNNTIANNPITGFSASYCGRGSRANASSFYLSDNLIFHNNFINNGRYQCRGGFETLLYLDYPMGGNYWNDYHGSDEYSGTDQNVLGKDGLGDVPYKISDYYAIDRYPLMSPVNFTTDLRQAPPFHNEPPVANFTIKRDNLTVELTDVSVDTDGFIYNMSWDLGDGTTWKGYWKTIEHTYLEPGRYNITLIVRDNFNAVSAKTITIDAFQTPVLYPDFTFSPESPTISDWVSFSDCTVNWKQYTTTTMKMWEFGDGMVSYGTDTSHKYANQGTYLVTLTVWNDLGEEQSISKNITVIDLPNLPPIANFDDLGYRRYDRVGDILYFNDTSTDPDGMIVEWNWSFGDGNFSELQNPEHSYSLPGTYPVTLRVTDDDGGTGNITATRIVIGRLAPSERNETHPPHDTNGTTPTNGSEPDNPDTDDNETHMPPANRTRPHPRDRDNGPVRIVSWIIIGVVLLALAAFNSIALFLVLRERRKKTTRILSRRPGACSSNCREKSPSDVRRNTQRSSTKAT